MITWTPFFLQSDKSVNPSVYFSLFHTHQQTHSSRHTHTDTHNHRCTHTVTRGEFFLFIPGGLHGHAKGKTKDKPEVDSKPAWLQTLSCTAVLWQLAAWVSPLTARPPPRAPNGSKWACPRAARPPAGKALAAMVSACVAATIPAVATSTASVLARDGVRLVWGKWRERIQRVSLNSERNLTLRSRLPCWRQTGWLMVSPCSLKEGAPGCSRWNHAQIWTREVAGAAQVTKTIGNHISAKIS